MFGRFMQTLALVLGVSAVTTAGAASLSGAVGDESR